MLKLPPKDISYWRDNAPSPRYPTLSEDMEVDAVIVGGGICGLSCAYLLQQAGLSIAVLEKDSLGSGTTGSTTGKVTSQHNLFYTDLQEQLGEKAAQIYASANNDAISQIEKIIKKEKIDCGWNRADHYVYTLTKSKTYSFKQEAKTAAKLGLPAAFVTETPLPFVVQAAVQFEGQATFNAQRYILGLATAVSKRGGHIYETSRVTSIRDGQPGSVGANGATVTAQNIIVATNVPTFPLLARGSYCVLEYPTTSYIVGSRVKKPFTGMYISPDEGSYSILTVPGTGLVLVGGENHIRGPRSGDKRWQKLAGFAEQRLNASSIDYKWSAWDYIAYDNVPLVGRLYPWSKNLYVATAFKKWGLTNTFVAAELLRDLIINGKSDWANTFTPHRLSPIKSIPSVMAKYLTS